MKRLITLLIVGVSLMAIRVKADTLTSVYIKTHDGEKIHYVRKGTGTPLILLHGNGQSAKYFKPQMDLPFDTIAIDSRNHGKSSSSQQLNFEMMAQDVLEVMDQLKIQKADILGFSDGANLAMVFAKDHPDRVNKLVLNSGNLSLSDMHFFSRLTSILQNIFFNTPVSELLIKDVGVTTADLNKFKMPVLVIAGQYDLIKLSSSRKIAEACHGQFIEIPDAFHKVSQSRPKTFNEVVTKFLQASS
ncbi:alpha/beta hydrolase [Lactococcus laudensis]|nr:alpha/beta hydrolase [Lactococcus laudensis]